MFLKLCRLAVILSCVALASCDELQDISSKQEIIVESTNASKAEENVDFSTIDNAEITVPLDESLKTNESTSTAVSDISTAAATSDDNEDNTGALGDMAVATTSSSDASDSGISISNATDSTDNGETETTLEFTQEPSTEDSTVNITNEPTVNTTVEATQETSTKVTGEPIIDSSVTVAETVGTTTTTTTTELPTTPIDILCPQVPDAAIDSKYRNETFESYLEEFLRENPLAKIYKSPGFPAPYAENLNCTLSVTLTNCSGIDIVVHYLDLNPFLPDTLNIRGGEQNASAERVEQLTGRQFAIRYKIIHTTSLVIWFNSGAIKEEYQGFLLTYSPYGNDTLPPTTTEAPVTIPPSEVQVYELQLVVSENNKNDGTWLKFKEVLANSASKYVADQNLNYQSAHPDNVTLDIFQCPNNWPNYKDCVRLQFSIALWNEDYDPEVDYDASRFEYELSTNSLSIMWDLYGRDDFSEILGIEEYSLPDGTYILLLWTGVSLSIVVIFIGVLYSIWRIDIFREYRRMYSKNDDQQDILKNKSELDISMYPIPHQPYPTLFETNEMNTGGYYDSYEINSTSFQGHSFHSEKSSSNYRQGTNHFSPNIIDFNDTQLFPDDEEDFGRVQSLPSRSKQKLLVLGAKRDESNT